jgi:TonB family protein
MSEQKSCRQCERAIDAWATMCPFCNWDQSRPAPAVKPTPPAAVTAYRPPEEYAWKRKALMAGVGILVLIAAFGVGMLINSDGAPEEAPATVEEKNAEEVVKGLRRADTPLVATDQPGGIEQPVTSAPVATGDGKMPGYSRTDATAVSATEYAEIAKRAQAEKKKMSMLVDPRTLTAPAYEQQVQRPRRRIPSEPPRDLESPGAATPAPAVTEPARAQTVRTRPVPEYQPLPSLTAQGTARLALVIGPDGRVRDIAIERGLAGGNTAELVAAVQRWRFKPATENGEPVSAPYSVDISFDR